MASGSQLVASCTGCRLARYSYTDRMTPVPGTMHSRRATRSDAAAAVEDASQVSGAPSGEPSSAMRAANGESTAPVERSKVPIGARSVTKTPRPNWPSA